MKSKLIKLIRYPFKIIYIYIRRIFYRVLDVIKNILALILLLILRLLKPFIFVKLCQIHVSRIGGLALCTELLLRRRAKDHMGNNNIVYLGLYCESKVANNQLLKMYSRRLKILKSYILFTIMHSWVFRNSIFYEPIEFDEPAFNTVWNEKPQCQFTVNENIKGQELFLSLGLKDAENWHICFNVRDKMYLDQLHKKQSPFGHWRYHDYRDSDVKTFISATEYIANLGGYALRMGKAVSQSLPSYIDEKIIDYAQLNRTDFGDIYLISKCKFMLADTAGLCNIPMIFNRPLAMANQIPLGYIESRPNVIFIPKKLWLTQEQRYLTFSEILNSEICRFVKTEDYKKAGIEVKENTPEEILLLTQEMNEWIDETLKITAEDRKLQNRFKELYSDNQRFKKYGLNSKISTYFLRKNEFLLS